MSFVEILYVGDIAFARVIAQEEGLFFLIVCNKFWSSDTTKKFNISNTKQISQEPIIRGRTEQHRFCNSELYAEVSDLRNIHGSKVQVQF